MSSNMIKSVCGLALVVALAPMTTSCGLYGKFETPEYEETSSAYGNVEVTDSVSLGNVNWREFFGDDNLAALIDTALANNVNMKSAVLGIEQAQAQLKAARLAYIPGFTLNPSAALTATEDISSWSVQLPVAASWQVDIFGSLTNAKRGRLAAMLQSVEYVRSVRSQLISTVATQYYTLMALDAQYEICKETEALWKENVETTRHLMEAGRYTSAAVHQAQANYYSICNSLVDIQYQISQTENQINSLLGRVSGTPIPRGSIYDWTAPEAIQVGIPLEVISNRPDVRQAEYQLAQAFYSTNAARSAMYPSITITGSYDFYSMIANAVGSLVMPLFQQGQLRANLKVAKATQEAAEASFRQSIIEAGTEVNNAVISLKGAQAKTENYALQVASLEEAVSSTTLLMQNGSTTYLEVLTAQQSLLSAQIAQVANKLSEITGTITLYQALGGGCE